MTVGLKDIKAARAAVYRVAHQTPLLHSSSLGAELGCDLYVKAECLQRTGSFKARGAANRLAALSESEVGSSRVDLQACKLEYSIVSPK